MPVRSSVCRLGVVQQVPGVVTRHVRCSVRAIITVLYVRLFNRTGGGKAPTGGVLCGTGSTPRSTGVRGGG